MCISLSSLKHHILECRQNTTPVTVTCILSILPRWLASELSSPVADAPSSKPDLKPSANPWLKWSPWRNLWQKNTLRVQYVVWGRFKQRFPTSPLKKRSYSNFINTRKVRGYSGWCREAMPSWSESIPESEHLRLSNSTAALKSRTTNSQRRW